MQASINDYMRLFVQPVPLYALRVGEEKEWLTRREPLSCAMVASHLYGNATVGSLGRWYPGHARIDLDHHSEHEIVQIRESLGLSPSNSMLLETETPGHAEILFIPEYNDSPPTVRLLRRVLTPYARRFDFEIFPTLRKTSRLPFGWHQRHLDEGRECFDWKDSMYWFLKLEPVELSDLSAPIELPQIPSTIDPRRSVYSEGAELFSTGLTLPSSRHDSQFKVLYWWWRQNLDEETAVQTTYSWILKKHNGFSRTINQPNIILAEIKRQARRIWEDYERRGILPDSAHNLAGGYICREDLGEILKITGGRLRESRFLFQLLRYAYPRRLRPEIRIHSRRLAEWSSMDSYPKRIAELEKKGIIVRGSSFVPGRFSKPIKVAWPFKEEGIPIQCDGRTPETFEEALLAAFTLKEIHDMFVSAGTPSNSISYYMNSLEHTVMFKNKCTYY